MKKIERPDPPVGDDTGSSDDDVLYERPKEKRHKRRDEHPERSSDD